MYIPVCVACVCVCNVRVWLWFCVDRLNTAVNKARWVERPDCEVVLLCRYQVSGSVSCLCCSNTHPLPASFILLSAAHLHRGFTGDKEESVSFSDTPLSPVITLNKSCFHLHALHDCYSIFYHTFSAALNVTQNATAQMSNLDQTLNFN